MPTQRTISPVDGRVYVERELATASGIDDALERATRAFRSWRAVPLRERAAILARFCTALESRRDAIRLVILDLTMPRLDGEEVFRRIKVLKPDVRVILMTGYAEEDVARRFSRDELSAILQKPFSIEQLKAKLSHALAPNPP